MDQESTRGEKNFNLLIFNMMHIYILLKYCIFTKHNFRKYYKDINVFSTDPSYVRVSRVMRPYFIVVYSYTS